MSIINITEGTLGIQGTVSGTDQTLAALTNANQHTAPNVLRIWIENQTGSSAATLQSAYDSGTGAIQTTAGKPVVISGALGEDFRVVGSGTFTEALTIGSNSTHLNERAITTASGIFLTSLTISGVPVSIGGGSGDVSHAELVSVSGSLQSQISAINADEIEPAIVGSNGIQVASGTSTITINGVSLLPLDGSRVMTGALRHSVGTAAAPSLSFSTDADLGFYRVGKGVVGVAGEGIQIATFSGTASKGLGVDGNITVTGTVAGTNALFASYPGLVETLDWFIDQPGTGTITLVQSAIYPFRVDRVIAQTQSNSNRSTLRIDGVPITGLSHLIYSTTAATYTATAANQVSIGQKLDATMSGSTGAEGLAFSVALVRL